MHTDATELKDLKAMVEKTVATYGRLDFAFNNAGVEEPLTPLAEKTEALYRQVMDTNVKGVLFGNCTLDSHGHQEPKSSFN